MMGELSGYAEGQLNPSGLPNGMVGGILPEDMPTVLQLEKIWADKYQGNWIRSRYYAAEEDFNDFSISVPPKIRSKAKPVVGWPAKAVRALADLSVYDGVSLPDGLPDAHHVVDLAAQANLSAVVPQMIVSAYTHSCSFLTVSVGSGGRVVFAPHSADWSSAIWDWENRRISAALTISDADSNGTPTAFRIWLPGRLYDTSRKDGVWKAERIDFALDRAPVVAFAYDPQLNRPFGRSRISKPLMGLTDMAYRTLVRMEASAEFYAAPKLWFVGADRSQFGDDLWKSVVSAVNAIPKDLDGDKPSLQQVQQASMQPHSDMLRTIALMVGSETGIPVSDLGITMDNPVSAEALDAAERKLSREADRQNRLFGAAIRDALEIGVLMSAADGTTPDVSDLNQLQVNWRPTREESRAARSDGYAKVAAVLPGFASSDVGLRWLGLTGDEIRSVQSAVRSADARQTLAAMLSEPGSTVSTEAADGGFERRGPSAQDSEADIGEGAPGASEGAGEAEGASNR